MTARAASPKSAGALKDAQTPPEPTEPTDAPEHQHGYIKDKDAYLRRLRRIEGQSRGIQRMVEDEQYCIDILTQISAMTKALQAVSLGLLDEHLSHCVVDAARESEEAGQAKVAEATAAIQRLLRS